MTLARKGRPHLGESLLLGAHFETMPTGGVVANGAPLNMCSYLTEEETAIEASGSLVAVWLAFILHLPGSTSA